MKKDSKQSEDQTVVLLDQSLRATDGFTQIPNSVQRHPTLTMGAKVVYGVLLSYAWQDHFCHPAQESLAHDCGVGIRQVQRLLKELKVLGAISWKQLGLNRPNRYYIQPITHWIKPKAAPNPLNEKDATNRSSPETTYTSGQEATNSTGQEATRMSHYKDSKKNTQRTTHTKRRVSSSLQKKEAQTLIDLFHVEHGRPAEGRKANRNELDFAIQLISNHGYEKASYVLTYGLKAAKETNYKARFFQGYEQYVAEALIGFDQHQERLEQGKRAEERKRTGELKALCEAREFYAQPIDQRVDRALKSWVVTMRTLKRRDLTEDQIAVKRSWLYEHQSRGEAEWRSRYEKLVA